MVKWGKRTHVVTFALDNPYFQCNLSIQWISSGHGVQLGRPTEGVGETELLEAFPRVRASFFSPPFIGKSGMPRLSDNARQFVSTQSYGEWNEVGIEIDSGSARSQLVFRKLC